jgi:hypothetical protein
VVQIKSPEIKDKDVNLVLRLEVDVEFHHTGTDGPSDAFVDKVDEIMSTYNVSLTTAVERVIGNAFYDRNSGNVKCFIADFKTTGRRNTLDLFRN